MSMNTGVLVLTDEAVLPDRVISVAGHAAVPADSTVITQCQSLGGKLPFEDSSLDAIIFVWRRAQHFGVQWFEEFSRVLKPNGKILLRTCLPREHEKLSSGLERQLLIAGFVELQHLREKSLSTCEDSQHVTIEAKRPSWTIGSSFMLRKPEIVLPKIETNEESDLIDEDSLLTEEDYTKPQLPAAGGDCVTGKSRKACKNCSCGRAGAEMKAERLELTVQMTDNPKSACGGCGLGDAFRCGGCPYRGLPPFNLGEKVSLPSDFLVTDM